MLYFFFVTPFHVLLHPTLVVQLLVKKCALQSAMRLSECWNAKMIATRRSKIARVIGAGRVVLKHPGIGWLCGDAPIEIELLLLNVVHWELIGFKKSFLVEHPSFLKTGGEMRTHALISEWITAIENRRFEIVILLVLSVFLTEHSSQNFISVHLLVRSKAGGVLRSQRDWLLLFHF